MSWLQVLTICGVLVGALIYVKSDLKSDLGARIEGLDKRIDDLRSEMIGRFDGLKDVLHSEIKRVEEHLERLERREHTAPRA